MDFLEELRNAESLFKENRYRESLERYRILAEDTDPQGNPTPGIFEAHIMYRVLEARFEVFFGNYNVASTELKKLEDAYPGFLESHPEVKGEILHGLGEAAFYQGEYEDSQELMKKARAVKERVAADRFTEPGQRNVFLADSRLVEGTAYWRDGDYYRALSSFFHVFLMLAQDHPDFRHYLIGRTLTLIGQVFFDLRKMEDAEWILKRSLSILEETLPPRHLYIGAVCNELGKLYAHQAYTPEEPGEREFGEQPRNDYLVKALGIFRDTFHTFEHRYVASLYSNRALARFNKVRQSGSQEKKAIEGILKQFEEEIQLREKVFGQKHHPTIGRAYGRMAEVHLYAKAPYEAAMAAQKGIIAVVDGFKSLALAENPANDQEKPDSSNVLLALLYQKAVALRSYAAQQVSEADAIRWMEVALRTVDCANRQILYARHNYSLEESKIALNRLARPIQELGFNLLLELQEHYQARPNAAGHLSSLQDKALKYIQQSKGSILLEFLQERQSRPESLSSEASFWMFEPSLEQVLRMLNGSSDLSQLGDRIRDFERMLKEMERLSKVVQENVKESRLFDLKAISQQFVGKGRAAIVSYFVGQEDVFAVVVDQSTAKLQKLIVADKPIAHDSNTRVIRNLADDFKRFFAAEHVAPPAEPGWLSEEAKFAISSHRLYQTLLEPLRVEDVKRLYILPDDFLYEVPFEALLTRQAAILRGSWASLPYLIKKHPVGYHISIGMLMHNHGPGARSEDPASYAGRRHRYAGIAQSIYRRGVLLDEDENEALLEIAQTSKILQDKLGWECFSHQGAKVDPRALKELIEAADIVHLAAHTRLVQGRPAIVLSDAPDSSTYLNLEDIYKLELGKCQLLILNACSTGNGEILLGEGVHALNRAFLRREASNVLYSIYQVGETSSRELINRFFRKLLIAEGKKPRAYGEALQEAKREMIAGSPFNHPRQWAGNVFMGDQMKGLH